MAAGPPPGQLHRRAPPVTRAAAALVLLGDEGLDITRLHRASRTVVDNIEKLLA